MEGCSQETRGQTWHLKVPAGPGESYRLAQLDDDDNLRRQHFLWSPPLHLNFRARTSSSEIPGTWGFGLWNDPFSLSLGIGGGTDASRLYQMRPGSSLPTAELSFLSE